jgi:hypothetical protein
VRAGGHRAVVENVGPDHMRDVGMAGGHSVVEGRAVLGKVDLEGGTWPQQKERTAVVEGWACGTEPVNRRAPQDHVPFC